MDIKNNPFFVLNVSCNSNRRDISAAADEMSFSQEPEAINTAQSILLNPAKRLSAELNWFPDVGDGQIDRIRNAIDSGRIIPIKGLTSLSRLNASIYNFVLACDGDDEIDDIKYDILDISEQFSKLDIESIADAINQNRNQAKIPAITTIAVEAELSHKRDEIKKAITDLVFSLNQRAYVKLVTMLAEEISDEIEYSDSVILSDIIDQYEIRMQSEIEDRAKSITDEIDSIKKLKAKDSIDSRCSKLIPIVSEWDRLAQPLQLKAQASGITHKISENLGYTLRGLVLWLNNDMNFSDIALKVIEQIIPIFEEVGGLAERFDNDKDALNDLVEKQAAAEYWNDLAALRKDADIEKQYATNPSTDRFIAKIKEIDSKICNSGISSNERKELRETLCLIGRDVALSLHNDHNKTELSYKISQLLASQFCDTVFAAKLSEDKATLERQVQQIHAKQEAEAKARKVKLYWGIAIAAILMFFVIADGISSDSGKSSSSTSGSNTAQSSVATTAPTQPKDTETRFIATSTVGQKVYVSIKSIWPAQGIYTQGNSFYSYFVCECQTDSGTKVYVYMTVSEYRKYFDADASNSIHEEYADEITLSPSKKIHGKVVSADSIISGLAAQTASRIIDLTSVD